MICGKCNGYGWVRNPHFTSDGSTVPSFTCKNCVGTGFVLGNARDVMECIDVHINNKTPLTMGEMKELKAMLLK